MAVIEATKDNFDEWINGEYAVVDFYGSHCGPCKALAPVYLSASNAYAMLPFLKVCSDKEKELSERFGIRWVPTVAFFRNGKWVDDFKGYADRSKLDEYITKLLYE